MVFEPKRVIFEPDALKYPLGEKLQRYFRERGVEISRTASHNRVTSIPGKTRPEGYAEAKRTLVVGVRRTKKFETCRPSAHFQLPLATSCPGKCEYCYLLTNMGRKPYVRIYVNTGEILEAAAGYIDKRKPELTVFEGAATSDPVPTDPTPEFWKASGSLRTEYGRFRFVTKFTDVDTAGRLTAGMPIASVSIPGSDQAVRARHPPWRRGWPRPEKWRRRAIPWVFCCSHHRRGRVAGELPELFRQLRRSCPAPPRSYPGLITHRFTKRAKSTILRSSRIRAWTWTKRTGPLNSASSVTVNTSTKELLGNKRAFQPLAAPIFRGAHRISGLKYNLLHPRR